MLYQPTPGWPARARRAAHAGLICGHSSVPPGVCDRPVPWGLSSVYDSSHESHFPRRACQRPISITGDIYDLCFVPQRTLPESGGLSGALGI